MEDAVREDAVPRHVAEMARLSVIRSTRTPSSAPPPAGAARQRCRRSGCTTCGTRAGSCCDRGDASPPTALPPQRQNGDDQVGGDSGECEDSREMHRQRQEGPRATWTLPRPRGVCAGQGCGQRRGRTADLPIPSRSRNVRRRGSGFLTWSNVRGRSRPVALYAAPLLSVLLSPGPASRSRSRNASWVTTRSVTAAAASGEASSSS